MRQERRIETSCRTHPLLEPGQVGRAKGVSLGDNRNQVDARTEALHDLDVERLQGVAGRADEVQACVNTEVDLLQAARLLLLKHVGLVLIVKELNYGHPRVAVIDVVAEARGVDDGQADCRSMVS